MIGCRRRNPRGHRAGAEPAQTVACAYARIRAHNDRANFITLRDQAEEIGEAKALAAEGDIPLPFHVVPFVVKDNIDLRTVDVALGP